MTSYTPLDEEISKSSKRFGNRPRPKRPGEISQGNQPVSKAAKPCQLCGEPGLSPLEAHPGAVLWLCKPCELYQYGPLPDEQSYQGSYHTGYQKSFARKVRSAMVRLSYFRDLVPKKDDAVRCLDIGCSIGASVTAAEKIGWNSTGVDVSKLAVKKCVDKGLRCFHIHNHHLPFQEETFDVITAWHVIEHVTNVQKTLQEWKRILRPGGVIALATPDASSPKVRRMGKEYAKFWAPEHIYTFTPENLRHFAERQGFEVLTMSRSANLSGMPAGVWFHEAVRRWIDNFHQWRGTWKEFCLVLRKKD